MENKTLILILFLGCAFLVANATEVTEHKNLQKLNNKNEVEYQQKYLYVPYEYTFPRKQSSRGKQHGIRQKRQIGGPAAEAMQRALTNNRVGQPEFGHPTLTNGYFNNAKNFGGRVGASAGVKVWESQRGRQSVGVGLAGQANAGVTGGRPFVNSPEVGAGLGYRNGAFSATAGVNHGYQNPFQRRPSTNYGIGLGYRF